MVWMLGLLIVCEMEAKMKNLNLLTRLTAAIAILIVFSISAQGQTNDSLFVSQDGLVSIGATDLDGTPEVGKLTVKGSTNDGSTNILVARDSDEINVFSLDTDGRLKLSILTDSYIPYHVSDSTGLGNSPISINSSSNIQINNTLGVWGTSPSPNYGMFINKAYTASTTQQVASWSKMSPTINSNVNATDITSITYH
jgi:hypothetical protein